ncbi:hypothetical protein PIB30_026064 [Stylosanthes scabra]|uniref:PB1-like domain-containing protein n=1 Tax=Stylosanthes scabra TaxID=79078 RepID=A0ABU6Q9T5_9FABA|nr:hypothetical protein [Stylosanthes scabra]
MDIDLVCFYDLGELVTKAGYKKYNKLLWHDISDPDLDTSLHDIIGDADINAMKGGVVMQMGPKEFHIYVEHIVEIPEVVKGVVEGLVIVDDAMNQPVILEDKSSNDSYESAEDEAYKPPPPSYEDDDFDSEVESLKKKKLLRKKSPKKVISPKHKKDVNEDGPSKGGRPQLLAKTGVKMRSSKYTGARRKHVLRDGNSPANKGLGQNSGPGPDLRNGLGGPSTARKSKADESKYGISEGFNGPSVDPNDFEQDSDYERSYEYESEAFSSSISLKVKAQFMKALSDYFVYEGMLCVHAVTAIYKLGLKLEDFVHKLLTMDYIRTTYSHFIKHVNSKNYELLKHYLHLSRGLPIVLLRKGELMLLLKGRCTPTKSERHSKSPAVDVVNKDTT